jgi:hypothetical protein
MTTSLLQAEPFNLQIGDSVYAKIVAHNTIGDGPESLSGNGALIVNVVVPDVPVDLARDNTATTTS